MQSQANQFYTMGLLEHPINALQINKQGKRQKICYKHCKKYALTELEIDQWDDLIYEITSWSSPGQKEHLKPSYCIDLNQLLTSFEFLADIRGKNTDCWTKQLPNSLISFEKQEVTGSVWCLLRRIKTSLNVTAAHKTWAWNLKLKR